MLCACEEKGKSRGISKQQKSRKVRMDFWCNGKFREVNLVNLSLFL